MIRALLFDFDGLILETEEPLYRAWQRIYRERGQEMPLDRWLTNVGTWPAQFDPLVDLAERIGAPLDAAEIEALKRRYYDEAMARQGLMPGVQRYLDDAKDLGLRVAVVSSSSRRWITRHLERFAIRDRFDAVLGKDDVRNVKPDPALYLAALTRLEVQAEEAIAFEDSRNGILAAKAAGVRCVAVPTAMTSGMDLGPADLRLSSLEAMPLAELIRRLSLGRSPRPGPDLRGAPTSD